VKRQIFLLTKQAYHTSSLKRHRIGHHLKEESWLGFIKLRLELFKHITSVSVCAQTNSDFTWVIHTKPGEYDWFKEERNKALENFKGEVVYINEKGAEVHIDWVDNIKPLIKADTTHILQFRMDDDDAIAKDFMARANDQISLNEESAFYTFPNGVKTFDNKWEYFSPSWANSFIGLQTTVENFNKSIYEYFHMQVGDITPVGLPKYSNPLIKLDEKIAWLWNRHVYTKAEGLWDKIPSRYNPTGEEFIDYAELKKIFEIDWEFYNKDTQLME